MIQIIPAIDIIDGRCVRLTQGDYGQKKVYDSSPEDMALRYADCGVRRVHLVDLDGAKAGHPCNLRTLERIASRCGGLELEWGGGVCSCDSLRGVFDAGASHAIAGSIAALEPELFGQWLSAYGSRMILGADVKDGKVAVRGWMETVQTGVEDMVARFAPLGLAECICTDISRDGMLSGPSSELYTRLQELFPAVGFTVSGGISSMDDIRALDALGLRKVIVGKAIYEGRISIREIETWSQNA